MNFRAIGRIVLLCLLAAAWLTPAPAAASSIEFQGLSHLQSSGKLDTLFKEGATVSSSSLGADDPLLGQTVYLTDFLAPPSGSANLFAITGANSFQTGDYFDNLNYSATQGLWIGDGALSATFNLTSLAIPQDYQIILTGTLTNFQLDNALYDGFMADLRNASGPVGITLTLSYNQGPQRQTTSNTFADTLSSGNLSNWAQLTGTLNTVAGGGVVPEPGTLLLTFSALAACAGLGRKRLLAFARP